MNEQILPQTLTTDVNVGLNEVVSIFVSKYEDRLYAQKEWLSKNIRDLVTSLKTLDTNVINKVDKSQYEGTIAGAGICTVVRGVNVDWKVNHSNKTKQPCTVICLNIKSHNDGGRTIATHTIFQPICRADVDAHLSITADLKDKTEQLTNTLIEIKGISRKERQVRARISEISLKERGYDQLLHNTELLKLVDLK